MSLPVLRDKLSLEAMVCKSQVLRRFFFETRPGPNIGGDGSGKGRPERQPRRAGGEVELRAGDPHPERRLGHDPGAEAGEAAALESPPRDRPPAPM